MTLSRIAALSSVVAMLILALGDILTTSPTTDELPHLVAGMTYLATGDYRVNPEHPPLVKLIAAASLQGMNIWPRHFRNDGSAAFQHIQEYWPAAKDTVWAQWLLAVSVFYGVRDAFLDADTVDRLPSNAFRNDATAIFRRARIVLLLLTALGLCAVVYLWSRELWGATGAAISLALFCFDPNFIAHSGLITTDAAVTLFMFASVYFFWRAKRRFSIGNVTGFALCTALAAVTKFSSLVLIAMLGALLLLARSRRLVVACAVALVATFATIWAVYGFRYQTTPGGVPVDKLARDHVVIIANDLRLLPQPYLFGLARMRADFVRPSYLFGEKRKEGVRSYFVWTFLTKTPLPTIAAIGAAIVIAIRRRAPAATFLLVPPAVYFATAVVADLNIGHRHVLPIYPFLYVLCGILPVRWAVAPLLAFVSCLVVFTPFDPMWAHHLSYFNELASGPRHGSEIVADSNIDWGQDLPRLARWIAENHIDEPLNLVYAGSADPRFYGIRYRNLNATYFGARGIPRDAARVPGWLAISVTEYCGAAAITADDWRAFVDGHGGQLAGRAGYSILIFRLTR